MALTNYEKKQAGYALKAKIHDFTSLASQLTTDCATLIGLNLDSVSPSAAQLNEAKVAYDAVRNQATAITGGHTVVAMSDATLWSEIAAEAAV